MKALELVDAPSVDDGLRITWLVCLSTARDVELGRVECPFNGEIDIHRCHECRFLEDIQGDRWRAECEVPSSAF
jgi:predicted RNA-binding Zn-ribbon protein involved in translation (DUF1610 family)